MSTLAKLRRVRAHLGKSVWPDFQWEIKTAEDIAEDGSLDPPCALLRGQFGPFCIDLHIDGISINP